MPFDHIIILACVIRYNNMFLYLSFIIYTLSARATATHNYYYILLLFS